MTPAISIITAAFGRPDVLRLAVQAALQQTFRDFELIVVTDGCHESARMVRENFNDARLRVHTLALNTGNQYGPNNVGLELAQGEYIAFLNQDDIWTANHLAAMHDWIRAHQADLVFALTATIPPGWTPDAPNGAVPLYGIGPKNYDPVLHYLPASSWLARRDALKEVRGWKPSHDLIAEPSQDLLYRLWRAKKTMRQCPELSVLHFAAGQRPGSYQRRGMDEILPFMPHLQNPAALQWQLVTEGETEEMPVIFAKQKKPHPLHVAASIIRQKLFSRSIPFGERRPMRLLLHFAAVLGIAPNHIRYRLYRGEKNGAYINRLRGVRGLGPVQAGVTSRAQLKALLAARLAQAAPKRSAAANAA